MANEKTICRKCRWYKQEPYVGSLCYCPRFKTKDYVRDREYPAECDDVNKSGACEGYEFAPPAPPRPEGWLAKAWKLLLTLAGV